MTEAPDRLEVVVGCGLPPQALAEVVRADELTAALEQSVTAGGSGRALRALARRVLFVPYTGPTPARGAVATVERRPDEIPLPVAEADSGGRFLLAFSSPARLIECAGADDAAWVLLPAAWLAARCPDGTELLIDSGSSCGLILTREMLAELLLRGAGVTTPSSITDDTSRLRAGLPAADHAEETAAIRRVAGRRPEVAAVHRAAFGLDEDDGPVWLAFGFQPSAGAQVDEALADAAAELASVTGEHVTLAAIGADAPAGSAERFLLDQAPTIYSASAETAS